MIRPSISPHSPRRQRHLLSSTRGQILVQSIHERQMVSGLSSTRATIPEFHSPIRLIHTSSNTPHTGLIVLSTETSLSISIIWSKSIHHTYSTGIDRVSTRNLETASNWGRRPCMWKIWPSYWLTFQTVAACTYKITGLISIFWRIRDCCRVCLLRNKRSSRNCNRPLWDLPRCQLRESRRYEIITMSRR